MIDQVTCVAPVNIATVKYWGKRNEDLILPLNDSISVTLNTEHLCAKTTAAFSSKFTKDRLWLNGVEVDISQNVRFSNCINNFKRYCLKRKADEQDKKSCNFHIVSKNNFPTAAGLASSAAGFACLVYSLAQLFQIHDNLSLMARLGSGSACRSIFGGFVQWHAGNNDDGSDSYATQLHPANHWPELKILILVVSHQQKKVSSTEGMKRSCDTSELLKYRASVLLPSHIEAMNKAITNKNFHSFAELTMKESNQFHAACLDSYPPIFYLNDVSKNIIELVHQYNSFYQSNKAAYTFDAGPNATIFIEENNVSEFICLLREYFPAKVDSFVQGNCVDDTKLSEKLKGSIKLSKVANGIEYIINTEIGHGPSVISNDFSLIDETGYPKETCAIHN